MPLICKGANCTGEKQASFGYSSDNKAIRCKDCKTTDMVNVLSKKCQNCFQTEPIYGYSYDNIPIRCKACKTNEMINVIHKICDYSNCNNYATCGYPNSTATHCETCMLNGMIILYSNNKCEIEGCNTIKSYGYEQEGLYNNPRRCYECSKNTGMIDLVSKKCNICKTKRPSFGYINDTKPSGCGDCKEEGMINIKDEKCQDPNCTDKIAHYGYPGYKPDRCAEHRLLKQKQEPKKKCRDICNISEKICNTWF